MFTKSLIRLGFWMCLNNKSRIYMRGAKGENCIYLWWPNKSKEESSEHKT